MTEEESADSCKSGWCSRFRVTVEPIIIVITLVINTAGTPLTDLVMRQACRMHGMTRDVCSQHEEIEIEVHRISANFKLGRIVIDTLPGCLLSLFASPWSDTNGRKPALIVALLGCTLAQGILTWMATIEDIHPYTLLLSGLPTLSGGPIIIILSSYCYLVDVSVAADRSIRFSIIGASSLCAQVIGSTVSPYLADISYSSVYGFNTVVLVLVTIYSIWILPESVKIQKDKKTNFFAVDRLVESFEAFFKKRPYYTRGVILAVTMLTIFSFLLYVGESEVRYQADMRVYHWDIEDYSLYSVITLTVLFICTFLGVYVGNTLLGIDEMRLMIGVHLLGAVGSFLMAWAPTPIIYYLVSLFRCFIQCATPLAKGAVSKIVEQSDVAKIISFMNTLDSFTPQLGALMYSAFYNLTVELFPFAIHLLSCGLGLAACLSVAIAIFLRSRSPSLSSEFLEKNENQEAKSEPTNSS